MTTPGTQSGRSWRAAIRHAAGCALVLMALVCIRTTVRAQQQDPQQPPPQSQPQPQPQDQQPHPQQQQPQPQPEGQQQTDPSTQNSQPAPQSTQNPQSGQQQPSTQTPGVWSGQPTAVQPRPGTQRPGGPDPDHPVHATGGIINDNPVDIFNRPGDYTQRQPQNAPPDPVAPVPASNLSQLNATPDSVQYADRARGPYRLSLEETGIWSNNLFNVNKGQLSGGYFDVAMPLGLQRENDRTTYGIYYRPEYTVFPQYSQLNHFSQVFSQDLRHKISDLTDVSWELAGGRVVTTGQYVPSSITVGSTTVVQAVSANNLEYSENLATNLGMTHRLNERDSISAAITGTWLEQPEGDSTGSAHVFLNRSELGGVDLHWTRLVSPRTIVGIEANDIFVRGLSPIGHSNFVTGKATFTTLLSQHISLVLGGGPMYGNTSMEATPIFGAVQGTVFTYAADAGVAYQTSFAKISAGYERALQIGFLGGSLPTQDFYGVFDRPLTGSLDLVVDTRYGRTSNAGASSLTSGTLGYSSFGVTSRLSDNITPNLAVFIGASRFQQNAPGALSNTFGRTDITGGLTYTFGIPLTRRGDRP